MRKSVLKSAQLLFLVCILVIPYSVSLSFGESYHGDSPQDAPKEELRRLDSNLGESTLSPGTQFSPTTDAEPWVKFKIFEGWDLDQYLFKESSPLDFFIDVDDFKPDPTISPKPRLTLRVWDVDFVAPQDPPERDRVQINGHSLGLLTGANNQWSTVSFDVEPSFIVEGQNHVQIFIDVLGDGWAVEVDRAELKIPFQIKVIKIEVTQDIDIKKGTTNVLITGPVWEKKFDANGKLEEVPGVGGDTKRDYPIADWFKSNKFKVKITVDAWPKKPPNLNPFIIIYGQTEAGLTLHSFFGWEGEYEVAKLPQKVLKTNFEQEFVFVADPGHIADCQLTSHTLYLTLQEPRADVKPPKERWLEVATEWGKDATTAKEVAEKVVDSEYANPFSWVYDDTSANWEAMIDTTPGDHANCYVFSRVWQKITRVLGINSDRRQYDPRVRFIISTKKALDNNNDANARNKATGTRDRWCFGTHSVGRFNGKHYDPTFGLKSFTNIEGNVYAKQTANTVVEGGVTYILFRRLDDPTKFIKVRPTATRTPNGWSIVEYKNPHLNITTSDEASILTIADSGLDTDGDGLFNYLAIEVEINATETNYYAIDSILRFEDTPISVGSLSMFLGTNLSAPNYITFLNSGINIVTLYFSGRSIYEAGINGNYTLDVMLYTAENQTDAESFNTSSYSYTQFQGLTIEVANLTDFGADTDGDGDFDVLTVEIEFDVLRTAFYEIDGYLLGIDSISNSSFLTQGPHTIFMNFNGSKIRSSRTNGPYSIELSLADENYDGIISYNTSSFSYTQFDKPPAEFTGIFSDYGCDMDSDGFYDFLSLEVGANVSIAASYTVLAYLFDHSEEFITAASNSTYLSTGVNNIVLNFDGTEIYGKGVNGPYTLRFLQLFNANGSLIDSLDNIYNTSAYSYTMFQRPEAYFTGTYSDHGVDTDIESTYNRTHLAHEWIGGGTAMSWHGDDGYGTYTLPFDFPFYDANYTTLYVSTNGLIAFLSPDSSYDNSIPALAEKLAIAPAWDDWATYEPYDIYTRQNSTHATIRWYVCDYYGYNIVANFEATLCVNGEIQFNYEYNNGTVSATIGISNGAGDILAEDVTDLNNINSIKFTPGFTSGDGFFNFLTVQADVNATEPGNYTLEGALYDSNDSLITSTTTESYFSTGIQLVELSFDGVAIYTHGSNGSYNLKVIRLYDNVGNIVDVQYNVYNTTAYNYTDFQRPIIKLTGVFSDYGVDIDVDGFYDYLAIEIEAIVEHSGTYEVNARLKDSNGHEIIWASNSTYLSENTPQTIQLYFDGRYIFGNGINGPYDMKDLSIYYSNMSFYTTDAYTTPTYSYTQFQKSATVIGTVTNINSTPVANALVYINAVDYKYTNINGSYKLVILQTGNYTVEVVPPPELNLQGNSTTTEVTLGEATILNFILQQAMQDNAVIEITSSKTFVGEGHPIFIEVTVENQVNLTSTFNVTAYADLDTTTIGDEITIGTQNVTLTGGNSTTLTFTWNTTGFAKGNYTLSAFAHPVLGETDITDNTYIDSWTLVTIPGDVDGDRDVDIYDIVRMVTVFGVSIPDPAYDPNCDIDGDGDIDIFDIVIACNHYGESW